VGLSEIDREKPKTVRATRAPFRPPSHEEVTAYCSERQRLGKPPVDPDAWLDHYAANGWHVGRNPMRDWRAAVRTWERNGDARIGPARPETDPDFDDSPFAKWQRGEPMGDGLVGTGGVTIRRRRP